MSVTRLDIEEECLRILSQRDEAVHAVPIPLTTTTVAGDTLSVRALPLGRGTGHANRFDACHVKVAETVGGGPAIGEVAAVDDGGFDNVDKLTTSPAFSAAVQTGTDLFLYPKGLTPEYLIERINSVLRHTDYPYIWAPSLVPDSDFAANDLTQWPAVGAPTTRQFTTTPQNMFLGERALNIIGNSGTGAQNSTTFSADKEENLLIQVVVQPISGTGRVVLYGTITSSEIKAVTFSAALSQALVSVMFTQVAGNTDLRIRLLSSATGAYFFISPPVVVQSQNRRQYVTPSWLTRKEQIKDVLYCTPQKSIADSVYLAFSQFESAILDYDVLRADIGINPLWIEFAASSFPVYFLVMRPFAELATDTATSVVDKDYVAAKTVANILRDRKDNEWTRWASKASRLASTKGYGQREVSIVEKLTS